MKKPVYYQTPLRSKADIVAHIRHVTAARRYHLNHPFCFNVKAHHVDFSFDKLLATYAKDHGDLRHADPKWVEAARQVFDDINENILWEVAQEDACRLVTDSDAYNHLWDGTPVNVEFSFEGRSGGWLSINSFDGVDFTHDFDPEQDLAEQDYKWLRRFYQFVVMMAHDTKDVDKQLEYYAADWFFLNKVNDLVVYDEAEAEADTTPKSIDDIPGQVYHVLSEELGMSDEDILALSPKEMFEKWLEWEGIIGYAESIWEIVTEMAKLPQA